MHTVNGQQGLELTNAPSALLDHGDLRQLWTTKLTHEQESYQREYQSRHPLELAMVSKIFHPKEVTGLFKK